MHSFGLIPSAGRNPGLKQEAIVWAIANPGKRYSYRIIRRSAPQGADLSYTGEYLFLAEARKPKGNFKLWSASIFADFIHDGFDALVDYGFIAD